MACPDENELIRFSRGALLPPEVSRLESHLGGCGECRRVVAAVALASGALNAEVDARSVALAPGSRLGRFEIERTLGSGAMGVVYAARDTQLGRSVALKVIHPALPASLAPDEARARILREAQSMAKLSHPNVISVFDIAPHGDGLFVAMELSDGVTLDVWRALAKPGLRDLLRVFDQAGQGLAAAHKAGIVHRDFKPQNVLVDRDGRVRVTDFGLARAEDIADITSERRPHPGPLPAGEGITRTGLLLGTPGYMAPEQFDGHADARSDQFAFAVALYEAIAGARPFRADSLPALREALSRGELPARPPAMPAAIHRVLSRALAKDPSARFQSMEALLSALARTSSGPSRRTLLISGAAVLFTVAASIGGIVHERDLAAQTSAPQRVALVAGQHLTLAVPHLSRLAIGDTSIAEAKADGDDRITVTGVSRGETTLLAWDQAGARREWIVRVTTPDGPATASDEAAMIRLRPGERRVLQIGDIERVAIGDPTLADIKASSNGEKIDIVALAPGTTTLLIWKTGGARRSYLLRIAEQPARSPESQP